MARSRSIVEQIAVMRRVFPEFTPLWRAGRVRWRGRIAPTSMSEEYHIQVSYRLGRAPQVRVLEPELAPRSEAEPIPHVYPGERLCLYLPRAREWTPDMFVATTTVPWSSLWLHNYEVWSATGTWHGGGVHPIPRRRRSRRLW